MMKSAVFLLGALAKCPLNARCKSLTMGESLLERIGQAGTLERNGVKYDGLFRAGDQVAVLQCPRKSKAPFAVATSNGLFVRFMATSKSPWQVSTVPVAEFGTLGCQKLTPFDAKTVRPTIKKSGESCGKGCTIYPAKFLLYPDATWVESLPKKLAKICVRLSFSVSSLNKHQREHLDDAMVAVFTCKRRQRIAWGSKKEPNKMLMIDPKQQRYSWNSLVKLVKVHARNRCN